MSLSCDIRIFLLRSLACDVGVLLMSLACDVGRKGEDKVSGPLSMANRLHKPSESDADIDRAKNRRPMHTDFRCDDVIAGIAFAAVVEAVQAKPYQHDPVDDGNPLVVDDAPQPIEGLKFWGCLLGIRHG